MRYSIRYLLKRSTVSGLLLLSALSLSAQTGPVQPNPTGRRAVDDKTAEAPSEEKGIRIKDLARIDGVRSNQLLGYGIVIGLQGTGDQRSKLALRSMQNLLANLGQDASSNLELKNVAAVLVTAEIPPFAKKGDRITVVVSSIGDAKSLDGGVLVQTPLQAGNGELYAVAQGPLLSAAREGRSNDSPKNVAVVPGGALIEKDLRETTLADRRLRVQLRDFDFTTLSRVHQAILPLTQEETLKGMEAKIEGGSVLVTLPENVEPIGLLSRIENLRVQPSYKARVVINQRTGTIVFGGDVRIDPVAVSRPPSGNGRFRLQRQEAYQGIYVRSPGGQQKDETVQHIEASSVAELVAALNKLGAGVRDIISILEALRDSGALHAEVVIL
ncbi:MAG: flagellar basal body P-ring protein FlgI [Leptonema illini]|uniref:Flagellar P-ring protein n=1 Tax=Leptonema illini TaxID=183 RepID=A0A833GY62_9LEPT|nr:MAG: flagellar basal body P-ring protein FlgI [Leptonema illini]